MNNFPSKSFPHTVRSSATLTTSYVAGTVISVDEQNAVCIQVDYTKGDETKMQLKLEASIDAGTSYGQQASESTSSGTITSSLAVREFSATGIYSFVVTPLKADRLKISVKAADGTPTGTCAIKAITGWV